MPKLHEVLAVEGDLAKTWEKVVEEAMVTLGKKPERFLESVRTTAMKDEKDRDQDQVEIHPMAETVQGKLEYVGTHTVRYLDVVYQKEHMNALAKADVELDGQVLVKEAPVMFLLALEGRLKKLMEMAQTIPTLAPSMSWIADGGFRLRGASKAVDPVSKSKTAKQLQHQVLVPATEQHPAQVEKWFSDAVVGKITEQIWSGMISPAEKSDLLGRIDSLMRAVKQARQRANGQKAENLHVAKGLYDYILGRSVSA